MGNEDQTCSMQETRGNTSSIRAPGECKAFPVEPEIRLYHHAKETRELTRLFSHITNVLHAHIELRDFKAEHFWETPFKGEHQWIFAALQGPMPRAAYAAHSVLHKPKLNTGVGALKGSIHVQINAPEYSAG
jgi:hypothetical protein